jgi:hypothetical protein
MICSMPFPKEFMGAAGSSTTAKLYIPLHALLKPSYSRSPSAPVPERKGMSMPKLDNSSRHFQRKISEFRELRIAPIAPKRVLENIRPYLINLIIYRKPPPILNGRLDIPSGVSSGLHRGRVRSLENSLEANHADDSRSNSSTDRYPH